MLRISRAARVRYVCLSWTADGGAVGRALPALGMKTYTMRSMLAQNQHGRVHPQLWSNLLRVDGEQFSDGGAAADAAAANDKPAGPVVTQSRIAAQNKLAQRLGLATTKSLTLSDIAEYDAICGLPVAAIAPEQLVDFFPAYTKFILVEENNKPEWVDKFVEDGIVPLLVNLRVMGDKSPTGKVWLSLFRHFAWPGSGTTVLETLPAVSSPAARQLVQPRFITAATAAAGGARAGGSDDSGARLAAVGDIRAVQARADAAQAALSDYERRVKAAVPSDRLYVFRAGDGWEPLVFFTGRDQAIVASLPAFPEPGFGCDFLDQVRLRIVRAVVLTKVGNVVALVVLAALLLAFNAYAVQAWDLIVADFKRRTGKA
jgi:hypothetical protein